MSEDAVTRRPLRGNTGCGWRGGCSTEVRRGLLVIGDGVAFWSAQDVHGQVVTFRDPR